MPGEIIHLFTGVGIFIVAEFYLKYKFKNDIKKRDHVLLFVVSIIFSVIPDFPLGLYYIFNISSKQVLLMYHILLHQIITPVSFVLLLFLLLVKKSKTSIIWIVGLICILVHIAMDLYIHEGGIWI